MSQASEVELLMLELINDERTSRGLDPLSINAELNDASEDHSQWMLETDAFSHTGVDGTSSRTRIEDANYDLEGSWRTAENIGWQSERGDAGIADDVRDIHQSLMNSPGHRANILNPDLEDIGIGVETGDFSGYDAVMITQNFGRTDAISDVPQEEVAPQTPVADADDTVDPTLPEPPAPDDVGEADAPAPTEPPMPDVAETPDDDEIPEGDDTNAPVTVTTGTVTNTVTETSIGQAGQDPITVMTDETNGTEMTSIFDDFFDFWNFADTPDNADDIVTMSEFEGTITTSDGTFETKDRAEFDMMLADLLEGFNMTMCGADTDFV